MLIKIEAIVREEKYEEVKEALNKIQVNGITVAQIMGCGVQRGYKEIVRGSEIDLFLQPKIKFEIVVSSEEWEKKSSIRSRKPHIRAKSETVRSSAMRSAAR